MADDLQTPRQRIRHGDIRALTGALTGGAGPDTTDFNTLCYACVIEDRPKDLQATLEDGASPHPQTSAVTGESLIQVATRYRRHGCLTVLLRQCENQPCLEEMLVQAASTAMDQGDAEILRHVFSQAPASPGRARTLNACLRIAASRGSVEFTDVLLAFGADPDRNADPLDTHGPRLCARAIAAICGRDDLLERYNAAGRQRTLSGSPTSSAITPAPPEGPSL